jgi:hypothetical protein
MPVRWLVPTDGGPWSRLNAPSNDGYRMAVLVKMASQNLSDLTAPTGDDDAPPRRAYHSNQVLERRHRVDSPGGGRLRPPRLFGLLYGQLMLAMLNWLTAPDALRLKWSTMCAVICDPSEPLTTTLRMSCITTLFLLRLTPNQNVNSPW